MVDVDCVAPTVSVAGKGTCNTWMPVPPEQLLSRGSRLKVPLAGVLTPLQPESQFMYQRSQALNFWQPPPMVDIELPYSVIVQDDAGVVEKLLLPHFMVLACM